MPRKRKPAKPLTPAQIIRRERAAANRAKHHGRVRLAVMKAGVPMPEQEVRFHCERKWRFDYAWVKQQIAIEINGGGGRGRHNTVVGATNDADKLNAAQLLGWVVLQYTCKSVKEVERMAEEISAAWKAREK